MALLRRLGKLQELNVAGNLEEVDASVFFVEEETEQENRCFIF
jgi:hypothetical protein